MKSKLTYFEPEQIEAFLNSIDTLKVRRYKHYEIQLFFKVLLYSAGRVSEILQLTPNLIGNKRVTVPICKGGVERCKCSKWTYRPIKLVSVDKDCKKCHGTGKVRVPQELWMTEKIFDELKQYAKGKPENQKLFPWGRGMAWLWINKLAESHPHALRHSMLTWMASKGDTFDILDVQGKARHTNLGTTSIYLHSNKDLINNKENRSF